MWRLAAWKFLKGIPWPIWAFLAVALAFYLYGEYKEAKGDRAGSSRVQLAWDKSVSRGRIELQIREAKRAKITVKTETVYVDRIRVVREQGQTLIQRIPALVPADACLLPAGFRLSHDLAAAGTVPDAASGSDAGATQPETIAWRPWDSSASAASSHYRGRELQSVSPSSRAASRFVGLDPRAGGR